MFPSAPWDKSSSLLKPGHKDDLSGMKMRCQYFQVRYAKAYED